MLFIQSSLLQYIIYLVNNRKQHTHLQPFAEMGKGREIAVRLCASIIYTIICIDYKNNISQY